MAKTHGSWMVKAYQDDYAYYGAAGAYPRIYDIVLSLISDNPAALKQFHEEFPPGTKNKNMFVNYHAFLRILKVYDSQ